MSLNILNSLFLVATLGILIPFAYSFNKNISPIHKTIYFLLLPIVEIIIFITSVVKAKNINDIAQYFYFRGFEPIISMITIFLIILGLSLTLIFVLIKEINRQARYAIKSITVSIFSFIILFGILYLS